MLTNYTNSVLHFSTRTFISVSIQIGPIDTFFKIKSTSVYGSSDQFYENTFKTDVFLILYIYIYIYIYRCLFCTLRFIECILYQRLLFRKDTYRNAIINELSMIKASASLSTSFFRISNSSKKQDAAFAVQRPILQSTCCLRGFSQFAN